MSATTSLSVRVRRLLGGGRRAEAERLSQLERRVAEIGERLDGLDAAVAQLHRTVVEAVREDVQSLTTQIDEQLVRAMSAQR